MNRARTDLWPLKNVAVNVIHYFERCLSLVTLYIYYLLLWVGKCQCIKLLYLHLKMGVLLSKCVYE